MTFNSREETLLFPYMSISLRVTMYFPRKTGLHQDCDSQKEPLKELNYEQEKGSCLSIPRMVNVLDSFNANLIPLERGNLR